MNISRMMASLCALALVVGGCSSRPRQFVATVNPPAADAAAYQRDFATCDTLARRGYKSGFKSAALSTVGGTAVGVAAGFGAAGIAAASTSATAGGIGGALNAAVLPGAVGAAAFFAVMLPAGFGVSRAIRGGREKRLKKNISSCLSEYGYTVAEWTRVKKIRKVASTPS